MRKWLERLAVLVAAGTLTVPAWSQGFGGTGGSAQPVRGSGFAPPAPAPAQPGAVDPNAPGGALVGAQGAQEVRADIILNAGDTFQLRHDSGKPIKDVVISRPGVVDLEVQNVGSDRNTTLKGTARAPGITTVSITAYDSDEITRKVIQVTPDVKYIESLLIRTFPTSNIRLIPGSAPNSLIATGTVESAEDVNPVLTFLSAFTNNNRDRVTNAIRVAGVMQVQLEVCIARVNRTELRAMGFNFLFADRQNYLGSGIGNVGNLSSTVDTALRGGTPLVPIGTLTSPLGTAAPSIQFGITDNSSGFLGFLQALRQESVSKTLANPTLVTTSGRVAEFLVGGERAAAVAGGATSGSTLQYRAFGTRLAFLPFVLGDGRLRLIILTEVSQPDNANSAVTPNIVAPSFITNRVHTAVEMENRQTLILGGIVSNDISGTTSKIPVLGDLPFVGAAFRSISYTEQEQEVVIMVTASLVDPLDAGQMAGYRLPGTETRSPTDFELFLEGIMEAPRGPRDPFPGNRYVAAHKMAPDFGVPQGQCWDGNGFGACGHGFHGGKGCGTCAPCGTVMPAGHQHAIMPATQLPAPAVQLTTMPLTTPADLQSGSTSGMTPPLPVGSRSMVVPHEQVPTSDPIQPDRGQTIPVNGTSELLPPVAPPAPPAPPSGPNE